MEVKYPGAGVALNKTLAEIEAKLKPVPDNPKHVTFVFPFKTAELASRYAGTFCRVVSGVCALIGGKNKLVRRIDAGVLTVTFQSAPTEDYFVNSVLQYCQRLTDNFNEDTLGRLNGPSWLDDYIASENMGLNNPLNMDNVLIHAADADLTPYIARFSKKPPTEEAVAYDERIADLGSALMNGYYDEQYWSDMADYLASAWGFKSREQAESFLSFLRNELPEYKGVSLGGDALYKIDLIVRKFEIDAGGRIFPGFMSELVRKVAEVFPGNDGDWDEITTQLVSDALERFDTESLEPKDYGVIRRYAMDEVTAENLPESADVKFNGIDTTGTPDDINFRLNPRRVAFRDVEQGIKPERCLIGGLVAIDMSLKNTLNTERLSQILLSFADKLESYKGQDIRQAMLDSVEALGDEVKARPKPTF